MVRKTAYYTVIGLLAIVAIALAEELYSDKYDYINAEDILNNDRLRDQYYKCFMDIGPCITPDAQFFKDHMAESLVTKCRKCTEKQKQNLEKAITWYAEHRPEEWRQLLEKFVNDSKKNNEAAK